MLATRTVTKLVWVEGPDIVLRRVVRVGWGSTCGLASAVGDMGHFLEAENVNNDE